MSVNGSDLVRYAVRESIMAYFKGDAVQTLLRLEALRLRSYTPEEEPRNERGRQYRYVEREQGIRDYKQLMLHGTALANLAKAPGEITINAMLKTSTSAAQALHKEIRQAVQWYLPHITISEKDLSSQENIDQLFTNDQLRMLVDSYTTPGATQPEPETTSARVDTLTWNGRPITFSESGFYASAVVDDTLR